MAQAFPAHGTSLQSLPRKTTRFTPSLVAAVEVLVPPFAKRKSVQEGVQAGKLAAARATAAAASWQGGLAAEAAFTW